MPRTPEATKAKPESEPQAPKPYGFEEAFDETGKSLEDVIQSGVSAGPPKVTYEQSGKRVNAAMRRYTTLGRTLFESSRVANARNPVDVAGRDIASISAADSALPGIDEYMQIVRRKVDAYDPSGTDHLPTDDEQAFMDAMEWSALREQRLAAPQEITALDYQGSPHGAPHDTYDNAQRDAIQKLIDAATQRRDEATTRHDTATAADQQRVIDELETYLDAFVDFSNTNAPNKQAASSFGEEILNGAPTDASRDAMKKQADLDRIFATYDGQVKGVMKSELDRKDLALRDTLMTHTESAQDALAAESARSMRSMGLRRNGNLASQAAYDTVSIALGRQELRIAQRIGTPNPDGSVNKMPSSGPEVNAFLATNHINHAKSLDAKIARELAENRTTADKVADFWAGKNNGEKEKRKTVNFVRRLAKVGAFTAMASFGPAGFALAAGTMIGAGKLSKYTSKHSHELRTRDMGSLVDERDLMRIINTRTISAQQKMQGLRLLERDRRGKDILSQQRRTQIAYGKAALWAAGVGLSPVYAPWVVHAGVHVAEQGWELASWTAGRTF